MNANIRINSESARFPGRPRSQSQHARMECNLVCAAVSLLLPLLLIENVVLQHAGYYVAEMRKYSTLVCTAEKNSGGQMHFGWPLSAL